MSTDARHICRVQAERSVAAEHLPNFIAFVYSDQQFNEHLCVKKGMQKTSH
jgi:hypothetical protein